jgi:hypothetical protein
MSEPDFQKEFEQALTSWRERHRIRDDDAVLFCVELFRIHQQHWDAIRKRDFPSLEDFTKTASQIEAAAKQIQELSVLLLDELRQRETGQEFAPPPITVILLTFALALATGLLLGKFLL